MNLCPDEHDDGAEAYVHINPRQFERGGQASAVFFAPCVCVCVCFLSRARPIVVTVVVAPS